MAMQGMAGKPDASTEKLPVRKRTAKTGGMTDYRTSGTEGDRYLLQSVG